MKIWWQSTVDYAKHPSFVAALQRHADRIVSPGTEVTFHGMDADQGRAELRGVLIDVLQQLLLGARWADQQPFRGASEGLDDPGKK